MKKGNKINRKEREAEEEILAKNSNLPDVKNTTSVYKIWRQLLITSSLKCGRGRRLAGISSDCFQGVKIRMHWRT
jgi:hypothetical protein